MLYFCGVDPGVTGGAAVINQEGFISRDWIFSFTNKSLKDLDILFGTIKESFNPTLTLLEDVHSRPTDAKGSIWTFAKCCGRIEAFLTTHQIAFDYILPSKWQYKLRCLTGGNKNITKQKAEQLYPHTKVTHAVADAMLIATYCLRQYPNVPKNFNWE